MLELDFKEPETFKTPDGQEWVINPLPTKDIKIIFRFIELNDEMKALKKNGETAKANKLIFGTEEDENVPSVVELTEQIIDLSVHNVEDEETLLPSKYRTVKKLIQLASNVAVVTMDLSQEDIARAGGNPLEIQGMLSDKSKQVLSSSKKKGGKRKN